MLQLIGLNLILGVVSGLVTASIVLFVRGYWLKVALPWYEERIYQDAHIETRWKGEICYGDEKSAIYIFDLKRHGHKVSGELTNQANDKRYILEGEFRNRILTMTYSSTMSYSIDRGCFTFLLINNGRQMTGSAAFYYSLKERVVTTDILLNRMEFEEDNPPLLLKEATKIKAASVDAT